MSLLAANHDVSSTTVVRSPMPSAARTLILAAIAFGVAGALAAVRHAPAVETEADLVHLLRFMAALKAALALGLTGAIWWRLAAPVGLSRLAAYAASCSAMAAGPTLIWAMRDVGVGALLLHAGLLASGVLLWRDPAVGARLSALVASRRR